MSVNKVGTALRIKQHNLSVKISAPVSNIKNLFFVFQFHKIDVGEEHVIEKCH